MAPVSHPLSLEAERVQDIQREFAHEIVATADSCLGQHAVCTSCPYVVLIRNHVL